MRKYLLPLVISIFLSLVSVYLLRNLNPFDAESLQTLVVGQRIQVQEELISELQSLASKGLIWEYLNLRNIGLILAVIGAAAVAGLTLVHLVVDKLFFKQFYQKPDLFTAIRRGALVFITLVALAGVRLLAGQWYLYLGVLAVAIALEVVFVNLLFKEQALESDGDKPISTIRLVIANVQAKIGYARSSLLDLYRQQQQMLEPENFDSDLEDVPSDELD